MRRPLRILFLGLMGFLAACGSSRETSAPSPVTGGQVKPPERGGEPIVRVRLRRDASSVRFTAPAKLRVYDAQDTTHKQILSSPLTISRSGGQWLAKFPGAGMSSRAVIVVEPVGPTPLEIEGVAYPGEMRLFPRNLSTDSAGDYDHFDLVNHVRLEEYLPGVLDRELYDHWEPAAYIAQAIAARTYAIDRIMNDGPGRHYDLESTQASQAYSGHTAHTLALRAVADTVGLVLTYNGRILPAYYSSTCGSAGQSPLEAFGLPNVAPLVPTGRCLWCAGSKYYRWGPVSRDRKDLSRRVAAWGKSNNNALGQLGQITAIRISRTNGLGRPTEIEMTDDKRHKYVLSAESFRHACNHDKPTPLPEGHRLRSSAFVVEVRGDVVRFTDGRGFGHCVGLCQFGAQAMAKAGRSPLQILGNYYNGASIDRAY